MDAALARSRQSRLSSMKRAAAYVVWTDQHVAVEIHQDIVYEASPYYPGERVVCRGPQDYERR